MDINIDALYNILKQNQGDVNDAMGSKKKTVVVTSNPLALIAEKTKVSKCKEKVVVSSDSKGSSSDDFRLPNDIYSLIDSNKTAKELWDALARHMLGSEYGEQDRKVVVLYEYETFKATKGELLFGTYIRYLQVINDLKKYGYSKDNYVNYPMGSKKKNVVVTSDPLALIAKKTKVSKSKEKVVVSSYSEGSEVDDFSELKKITA
nr:RNA-directed DNA polymerase, eukaryota [Tanacetum cinerariifolium]